MPYKKEFFDKQGIRRIPVQDSMAERNFMASILSKPAVLQASGVKVLDSYIASRLVQATESRYVTLDGLKFCDILNGAVLDSFVPLMDDDTNLEPIGFADMIDSAAKKAYKTIMRYHSQANLEEAKRLACYFAGEGSNPTTNLSESTLVVRIHPVNYFAHIIPTMVSNAVQPRKKFKIAYLIMVEDTHGFDQLKQLLDILNDRNGIILIHVDKYNGRLYKFVEDYIANRENSYLAKNRYGSIAGHISVLYIQLSGFYELADLADWDYVVNLSNFDWPLKHTAKVHQILSRSPGKSYIEFMTDTGYLPTRIFRPHLGDSRKTNYHSPELGITSWPFPYWQAYRQSQWMILSRSAIEFLRTDQSGYDFLAFLEHANNPEETFFATVLANSPVQKHHLIQDKKRFVRDSNGGVWCGINDIAMFPPGSSDPAFLFLRPFNTGGTFFGEAEFKEWVQKNHLDRSIVQPCTPDQLGRRDECIRELVAEIAVERELIVVPIGTGFEPLSSNLRCSLTRLGITNILYWSLDKKIHKKLVLQGLVSYYSPKYSFKNSGTTAPLFRSKEREDLMKSKPSVLLELLNAGFNVWFLDADVVAKRNFRTRAQEYSSPPYDADLVLSISDSHLIQSTDVVVNLPQASAGIMFLKATERAKDFLKGMRRKMEADSNNREEKALQETLSHVNVITFSGIGTLTKTVHYPKSSDSVVHQNNADLSFMKDIAGFFTPYTKEPSVTLKVHFFDHLEFMNGEIYFQNPGLLPDHFSGLKVVRAAGEGEIERAFWLHGLWFLKEGICEESATLTAHSV